MSSNWCSKIPNNTPINAISIPGTHDAAAWTHYSGGYSSTPGTWAQRKSILEQLNLGVRVLDLRVGYASNNWFLGVTSFIGMYHGPVYLDLTLQSVLTDVKDWLAQYPKEFVILIFQQQGKPGQRDVAAGVLKMVQDTFQKAFYRFNPAQGQWQTVGRLRGKVLVMARLRSTVSGFCDVRSWVTAGDNTDGVVIEAGNNLRIFLQDRYKGLSGEGGFKSKEEDNKKKFTRVKAAAANKVLNVLAPQLLRINHMSYSNLRYQPWQLGEGMNTLLRNSRLAVKGVLMLDDACYAQL